MCPGDPSNPMLLTIDPDDDRPVFRQIIDAIGAAAATGRLKAGDPLPSVRQLAADLGINPNTVSKAYQLLERDGLIRARRRRGYHVAEGAATRAKAGNRERLRETLSRFVNEGREQGLSASDLIEALSEELELESGGSDRKEKR